MIKGVHHYTYVSIRVIYLLFFFAIKYFRNTLPTFNILHANLDFNVVTNHSFEVIRLEAFLHVESLYHLTINGRNKILV